MSRLPSRLRFIEPQLAFLVEEPPEGKHWIHEIKHDGYRSQVVIEHGEARVFTRNGHDWTERFPVISRAALSLPCRSAILDGEAVVQWCIRFRRIAVGASVEVAERCVVRL